MLKLRAGVTDNIAGPSAAPPAYNENQSSAPPPFAPAVYSVGDPQFSPHPFDNSGNKAYPSGTEPPAY